MRILNYCIRAAGERDCAELARLAGQLGYPASDDAVRVRLRRLLASPGNIVLVAESAAGELVGWVQGVLSQCLESDHRVEITGLVVDERFRRKGIGRDLIGRIESWAVEQGAEQASVRSRTTRADAHRFYESLGFSLAKTQVVFRKTLTPRPNVL